MSWNHSHIRKFSLGEHAAEQRRAHRQFCSQQFSNSRNWNEMSTISSEDSDSDEVISDSEMDYENYNFLQVKRNSTLNVNLYFSSNVNCFSSLFLREKGEQC